MLTNLAACDAKLEGDAAARKLAVIQKIQGDTFRYAGKKWDVKSLKRGLAYLIDYSEKDYAFIRFVDDTSLKIVKRRIGYALADITRNQYGYYFEVSYQLGSQEQSLHFLSFPSTREIYNSYTMEFVDGEYDKKSQENGASDFKFTDLESKEINLMRFLVDLEREEGLLDDDPERGDGGHFFLGNPAYFYFQTYTNRVGRGVSSQYYGICIDGLRIKCQKYCYQVDAGRGKLVDSKNFKGLVKPLLSPPSYSFFVIQGSKKSFYDCDTFIGKHPKHWVNDILKSSQIQEIIQAYNLAFELSRRDPEETIKFQTEEKDSESEVMIPRVGAVYKSSIMSRQGNLSMFRYEHKLIHFCRSSNENISFHEFLFFYNSSLIQVVVIPRLFLEGKSRLIFKEVFEKGNGQGIERKSCSDEENEQYALMLIHTLVLSHRDKKGKKVKARYALRGVGSKVQVLVSKDKVTLYKDGKGFFSKKVGIELEGYTAPLEESERKVSTQNERSSHGFYLKGGLGIIATLMLLKYGFADDKDKESEG